MNETVEVRITIKKKDLIPLMEKLGVEEWSFKKDHVDLDMTKIFDEAQEQLAEKPASSDPF